MMHRYMNMSVSVSYSIYLTKEIMKNRNNSYPADVIHNVFY